MPDLPSLPDRGPSVVVHKAGSPTEAMVIRGLLESAGIRLPEASGGNPFPLKEAHSGEGSVNIEVLASQAEDARRIIADYQSSEDTITLDDSKDEPSGSTGEDT